MHRKGVKEGHVVPVPHAPGETAHAPSGQGYLLPAHSAGMGGQSLIEAVQEASKHLTGLEEGHTMGDGQLLREDAHARPPVVAGHVTFSDGQRSLHFSHEGRQPPSRHLRKPGEHVWGVGHSSNDTAQAPVGHRSWPTGQVSKEGGVQLPASPATEQRPSAHLTGRAASQVVSEGQSSSRARHVPSEHRRRRSLGQDSDKSPAGQLELVTTHDPSQQSVGKSVGQVLGVVHIETFTAHEPSGH